MINNTPTPPDAALETALRYLYGKAADNEFNVQAKKRDREEYYNRRDLQLEEAIQAIQAIQALYQQPTSPADTADLRELQKQIADIQEQDLTPEVINIIMHLVAAHTAAVVAEAEKKARIQENQAAEKFARNEVFGAMPISLATYFNDRISVLTAQDNGKGGDDGRHY